MGVPYQAHLADPFVKVKGLLTDLINFGSRHQRTTASTAPFQPGKVATVEFEVLNLMCGSCGDADQAARNVDWPSGVDARAFLPRKLARVTSWNQLHQRQECFDGAIEDVGFEVTVRMAPSDRVRYIVDDFGQGSGITCGSCMSTAGGAFRQEVQVDFREPTDRSTENADACKCLVIVGESVGRATATPRGPSKVFGKCG